MTIDEAIKKENETAEENQRRVDTETICDDISLSELLRDNTKAIKRQLGNFKKSVKYHKKIADWLEELKAIKELDLSIPQHFTKEQSDWIKAYCIKRNIEFYNKALDDFVKFANTMPTVETEDGEIRPMRLEEMAEKLKAGDTE